MYPSVDWDYAHDNEYCNNASISPMFLPLKADFALGRFPVLTVLVCLICIGVFLFQVDERRDYTVAAIQYCNAQNRSQIEQMILERVSSAENVTVCPGIVQAIIDDPYRSESEVIQAFARNSKPLAGYDRQNSTLYITDVLQEEVYRYRRIVPDLPDRGLAYFTGSWNPITMLTSGFAHGGWGHIVFNLIFFFAFATTVENLLGPLRYLGFIVADSLFIGVMGSLAAAGAGNHYWTLGLSGIVMGMIGLFAYLLPRGKIKCFYFFIVVFGFVAVPGWILALWYIGGDVYRLFAYDDHGLINVMAHVMGGVGGYLFGATFLRDIRKDAEHVQDTIDRSRFEKRFR